MIPQEKLVALVDRHEELEARMAEGTLAAEQLTQFSREYSELTPVVEKVREYLGVTEELEELEGLLTDPETDQEMRSLANEEITDLKSRQPDLEQSLRLALLPRDEADGKNVILEVRAGTGGDEAALFAGDLFRMYQRYSELKGWKLEVLEASESAVGGYKEIKARIAGTGVFARMKYESGVHRVQRVPTTESGGRIHTSAATVAVLPEAEEVDIDIQAKDIRIDTMRASGAGGQHVNTTDSAVRITHIPTGVVVTSSEKSQHQNRARAMDELRTRLYDLERQKVDDERSANRKGQVGSGDRSERIRTYNFPQGRVTDHRINLTLYKLDRIITGDELDEVVEALIAEDEAARLVDMESAA